MILEYVMLDSRAKKKELSFLIGLTPFWFATIT